MKRNHKLRGEKVFQRFTFYLALIILTLTNLSLKWPVKKSTITSTFGESRQDHFHDGVDIISSMENVYPVDTGRLYFKWNKTLYPLENYPGAGNYKIIKHDENIYSIYMHLGDMLVPGSLYTVNEPIGILGNSGHSFGKHLHFSIFNMKNGISFNPFNQLPVIYDDKKPPVINGLYFKIKEKYVLIRNKSKIRLTRHYPALIKIYDTIKGNERLGINKLRAVFNGKEVLNIKFDSIKLSENENILAGKSFNNLYDAKGYYKIEGLRYINGLNQLIVYASDFTGNKSEKKFILNVNLDMN